MGGGAVKIEDGGREGQHTKTKLSTPVMDTLSEVNITPLGVALDISEFGTQDGHVVVAFNREADFLGAVGEVGTTPLKVSYW